MGSHLKWILGFSLLLTLGCEPSVAPSASKAPTAPPEVTPALVQVQVDLIEAKELEPTSLRLIQDRPLKGREAKPTMLPFKLEGHDAWLLKHVLFERAIAVISPLHGEQEQFSLYDLKTGSKLSERQGRFLTASSARGWIVSEALGAQSEVTIETLEPPSIKKLKVQTSDKEPVQTLSAIAAEQLWILAPAHGARQTLIGAWSQETSALELSVATMHRINDLKAEKDKLIVEIVASVGLREGSCDRLELTPSAQQLTCLDQPKPEAWRFEGKRSEAPILRSPQGQLVSWRMPEGCTLDINAHLIDPAAAMLRCLPKKDQAPQWWIWSPAQTLRLPLTQAQLTRGELKSSLVFTADAIVDMKRVKLLKAHTPLRALEGVSAPRKTLVETAPALGTRGLWLLDADDDSLRLLSTYDDCPVGAQLQQDGAKGDVVVISCRGLRKNSKEPLIHHWTERLNLGSGERSRLEEGFPEALHDDGTLILSDRAQHPDLHISKLWVLSP